MPVTVAPLQGGVLAPQPPAKPKKLSVCFEGDDSALAEGSEEEEEEEEEPEAAPPAADAAAPSATDAGNGDDAGGDDDELLEESKLLSKLTTSKGSLKMSARFHTTTPASGPLTVRAQARQRVDSAGAQSPVTGSPAAGSPTSGSPRLRRARVSGDRRRAAGFCHPPAFTANASPLLLSSPWQPNGLFAAPAGASLQTTILSRTRPERKVCGRRACLICSSGC